eukprot:TRINITY_DN1009_c0_g1_i2.p1 TRINITY_DN1009_c0_g1~~TRINITY_DN1009_c0_g1_i2.p1  ORF type:complete len:1411 (-),score=541.96 TRINITY_DN1009_c0_g1_i2:289-4521(-)
MMVLGQDVWKNWEKTGKTEFVKVLKSLLEEGGPNVAENPHHRDIYRHIYDLIWQGVRDKIKREQVVQCLGELIALNSEVANLVTDIIAIVDTETGLAEDKKDERSRLTATVREIERFLSDGLVKERLEIDTLGECGILKHPKKFFTTVIKLKTKLFYKQQKFNLFREECEGYAKLITELNQDLSSVTPTYIIEVIKSVIGYFNLDPNRVLDIILESFECQPSQHKFFISLLGEYLPDTRTMCELLSFKYSFYLSSNNEDKEVTPKSLYVVTALLIQHDIMKLEDVYPLLRPDDSEITKLADKEMRDAKDFVRRLNVVSTQGKDEEKEKEDEDKHENNQKFGLLEALIKVGDWTHAEKLLCQLPTYYATAQPGISKQLCKLIHILLDPVYQVHSGLCSRIKVKCHQPLDNVHAPPQALTFDDLKKHVFPMLLALGPHAQADPTLLYKVLRICKTAMGIKDTAKYDSEVAGVVVPPDSPLYFMTLTLMDEVFLPSLSLLSSNCCLAEEIWSVLRHFPYEQRYRLYDQWKGDTTTAHPILLRSKAAVLKSIKKLMQRVSKENVKPTGRQLGKLSHSSPGLLFTYILSQIQVYDNLIGPVVDSLKYLTNLSFDVLGFCIIESLNDPGRARTKTDGTSISMWLTALSSFCGAVYKKHNIELTGLLQYVANQLKAKHSLDLIIIKEVVAKMGGIEGVEEMTTEQIEATAGGELLRQEASSFTQVKNTRKSSQRLKDCLIEKGLAVPLVLMMAQQGNSVVYQETESDHLKLVGKLFDQCHDTLVQFGTFLASNLSQDDYTQKLPPIEQLLSEFHVNADIAFFLARPMFNHLINTKFDDLRKNDKLWKQRTGAEKQAKHAEAAQLVMEPITAAVIPIYPPKVWEDISPQFCTTFWSLTMYDLYVPEKLYEKEIKKLKEAPAKLIDNKDLNTARRKKEADRLNTLMERLQDEEKRHKEHVERVMARLRQEKDAWFLSRTARAGNSRSAKNETITQFLQFCLFPRCIFTSSDAIYAAKFVSVIHMLKTPNFSTLICYDRIFCDITYTVTCCTENEAGRYGRFLAAMLETVMKWHAEREVFERECSGYPGFITKFRVTDKSSGNETDTVDFENYRHVCHKWHYKIAKALVVCLESKDFVQIRNSLIVLTKIIHHFPAIQNLATVIEKRIEKVCEDEKDKRQDLYIKARSYQGQLGARKSKMMKESDFHVVKGKKGEETEAVSSPAKKEREKGGEGVEEGEIRSSGKEKRRGDGERRDRSSASKERNRDSESKERNSRDRDVRDSRERDSHSRDRNGQSSQGDMGPPATSRSTPRRSVDPDAGDRDPKRRRGEDKEKEKEKSPVLDRLEKNEKLRKEKREKEKMKKDKEEKETKREKKRDRDDSVADSSVKKRKDESERIESPPARQNGSEEKRKSSSDRKR